MILEAGSARDPSAALAGHLRQELAALPCGENGVEDEVLDELAGALHRFLDEEVRGAAMDVHELNALAARVLRDLGRSEPARRLYVFGSGLVAPSEWAFAGGHTVWVLDLRHILVFDTGGLELLLFAVLRAVVEAILEVWDASAGQGLLALRHVSAAAAALAGSAPDRDRVRRLRCEVRAHCRQALQRAAERRGWSDAPVVLDLDG